MLTSCFSEPKRPKSCLSWWQVHGWLSYRADRNDRSKRQCLYPSRKPVHRYCSWRNNQSTCGNDCSRKRDVFPGSGFYNWQRPTNRPAAGKYNRTAITVVLGDPVAGISSWPPTPAGLKSPAAPFTWGKYRYCLFDDDSNPWAWFLIVAFDQSNIEKGRWQINGARYITGLTIDYNAKTFIITAEQYSGASPIIVPWSDVFIAQP